MVETRLRREIKKLTHGDIECFGQNIDLISRRVDPPLFHPADGLEVFTNQCPQLHLGKSAVLVNQQQKEEVAKEEEFLLRNWSYGLKEKIVYKAKKAGINVIEE